MLNTKNTKSSNTNPKKEEMPSVMISSYGMISCIYPKNSENQKLYNKLLREQQ